MPNDIAVIILAAGGSSRLGKPKQLLPYKNTTLINHAIGIAKGTGCTKIIVVTGSTHKQVAAEIKRGDVVIVENKDWQSGMASSIHTGIKAVQTDTDIEAVIVMLCDQPLITTLHLNKLITELIKTAHKIIATAYADITGVPAVFPAEIFNELLNLTGDEGAKHLIQKHKDTLTAVPFEGAALDIDTQADYQKLSEL